jgi:hypothetical protein
MTDSDDAEHNVPSAANDADRVAYRCSVDLPWRLGDDHAPQPLRCLLGAGCRNGGNGAFHDDPRQFWLQPHDP